MHHLRCIGFSTHNCNCKSIGIIVVLLRLIFAAPTVQLPMFCVEGSACDQRVFLVAQMTAQKLNSDPSVLPNVTLEVQWTPFKSQESLVKHVTQLYTNRTQQELPGVLAPFFSSYTLQLNSLSSAYGRVMLSWSNSAVSTQPLTESGMFVRLAYSQATQADVFLKAFIALVSFRTPPVSDIEHFSR